MYKLTYKVTRCSLDHETASLLADIATFYTVQDKYIVTIDDYTKGYN